MAAVTSPLQREGDPLGIIIHMVPGLFLPGDGVHCENSSVNFFITCVVGSYISCIICATTFIF